MTHEDEGFFIPTLRREVDAAQARLGSARAGLAKLEAGYRPQEVREAQAAVAQLAGHGPPKVAAGGAGDGEPLAHPAAGRLRNPVASAPTNPRPGLHG